MMDAQDFIVNRDQHMRPLEYDLSENFNELLRYMQDMGVLDNVPVGVTSESEIVSISDAYPAPPRALNVFGKSTQAGTPTPDAPVPILSVDDLSLVCAGKNILDPSFLTRCGWTESNGQYTGTPKQLYQGLANHILPVACAANTQYTFAWYQVSSTNTSNSNALEFKFVYSDGTQSASRYTDLNHTFTAVSAEGKTVVGLRFSYVSNPTLVVKCVQLVPLVAWSGTVEENYQPYITPTTVSDLLPEGTVLRSLPDGTKDQLNLTYLRPSTRAGWAWYSREVVQSVGHVADMGELAWSRNGNYAYQFYWVKLSDIDTTVDALSIMCTKYQPIRTTDTAFRGNDYNGYIAQLTTSLEVRNISVQDSSCATVAEFASAVAGATLLYPLATPVSTTLDPIELPELPAPNATVWCDGGSAQPTMVLEYVRDTNAAIAELSEAIADIVSG